MDVSSKEAFAVREFCDRYGICRDTFYGEVKRGRLRALKVGKRTLVLKSDAEAWATSLPELRTVGHEQASA
jgi:excisionase family DNA binding protein